MSPDVMWLGCAMIHARNTRYLSLLGTTPLLTLWPTRVPVPLKPMATMGKRLYKSHAPHLSVTRPQTRHSSSHVDRSPVGTFLSFFCDVCARTLLDCARSLTPPHRTVRPRPTPRVDHTFVPPCGFIAPQFRSTGISPPEINALTSAKMTVMSSLPTAKVPCKVQSCLANPYQQ